MTATQGSRPQVRAERIYRSTSLDRAGPAEEARVLVDRLWPRGVSRAAAALDDWCRSVAPSTELRTWFAHDPARYDEFVSRYLLELASGEPATALAELRTTAATRPVLLLTAAKPLELSHAAVLVRVLTGELSPQ
jgi:uncharacterized protein YeaO (DUF488 family)